MVLWLAMALQLADTIGAVARLVIRACRRGEWRALFRAGMGIGINQRGASNREWRLARARCETRAELIRESSLEWDILLLLLHFILNRSFGSGAATNWPVALLFRVPPLLSLPDDHDDESDSPCKRLARSFSRFESLTG